MKDCFSKAILFFDIYLYIRLQLLTLSLSLSLESIVLSIHRFRYSLIEYLKIVSYKQTLRQKSRQRIDISKRSCRGSSAESDNIQADDHVLRGSVVDSLRHSCRSAIAIDARAVCRADCRQSSDTIEERDLRAIKTP